VRRGSGDEAGGGGAQDDRESDGHKSGDAGGESWHAADAADGDFSAAGSGSVDRVKSCQSKKLTPWRQWCGGGGALRCGMKTSQRDRHFTCRGTDTLHGHSGAQ
jgi:hypothetical protein